MLKAGDVVDAEVTKVEVFGIFCRHQEQELLVLIPETSWIASFCSCEQFAQPRETLTVKVLRIDRDSGKVAATIKGRYPNPWESDQLNVGCCHNARVVRYVADSDRCNGQPAYLIEIVPGAYTMLCDTSKSFSPGDHVAVTIQSSDPMKLAVTIAVAG